MKITILQNDQVDFKKSKVQIETDFSCLGDMSAAVLLMICGSNPDKASLASVIVSYGTAQQREKLFTKLETSEKEFSSLIDFLRHTYNARDIVKNQLSQPVEGSKWNIPNHQNSLPTNAKTGTIVLVSCA